VKGLFRLFIHWNSALLRDTPLLQKLITRETADTFELTAFPHWLFPKWDVPIDSAKQRQRRKLGKVCNLQRSDEVIRFIRAPDDRILTMRA
jgi:hypothetical protein